MIQQNIEPISRAQQYLIDAYSDEVMKMLWEKAVPLTEDQINQILEESHSRIRKVMAQEIKYTGSTNVKKILTREKKRIFKEYLEEDGELIYIRLPSPKKFFVNIVRSIINFILFPFRLIRKIFSSKKDLPVSNKITTYFPQEFLNEEVRVKVYPKKVKHYLNSVQPFGYILVYIIGTTILLNFLAKFYDLTFQFMMVEIGFTVFMISYYNIRKRKKKRQNRANMAILSTFTLLENTFIPRKTILQPPKGISFEEYSKAMTIMIHKNEIEIRRREE